MPEQEKKDRNPGEEGSLASIYTALPAEEETSRRRRQGPSFERPVPLKETPRGDHERKRRSSERHGRRHSSRRRLDGVLWIMVLIGAALFAFALYYSSRRDGPARRVPVEENERGERAGYPDEGASREAVAGLVEGLLRSERVHERMAALLQSGQLEQAISMFRGELAGRPGMIAWRETLALLEEENRRYEEAAEQWLAVLAMEPERKRAKLGFMRTLLARGHFEAALLWGDALLERDPRQPEALEGSIQACLELRRLDEAVVRLRKLILLQPERTELTELLERVQRHAEPGAGGS